MGQRTLRRKAGIVMETTFARRGVALTLLLAFPSWASASDFRVTHSFVTPTDGSQPFAGVTLVDSMLIGTTVAGGDHGSGTIYSVRPDGSDFQVLHSFDPTNDGYFP